MKLAYPDLLNVIAFNDQAINEVVIENKDLFREITADISLQLSGHCGKTVLSIGDTPVELSRHAEMFREFSPFNLNQKSLISKIVQALERESGKPVWIEQSAELLRVIELYLDNLSFDFPCDLTYTKMNISGVIKAVGIEIIDDDDNDIERLIDYMQLVREYDRDKLYIMVNMRSFFTDDIMEKFIETVLDHRFNVLLLEGHEYTKLNRTNRLIVDEDLCEIPIDSSIF